LLNERGDDLKFFADRIDKTCIARVEAFVSSAFERMTYTDAIAALEKSGKTFEFPVHWGMDLQSAPGGAPVVATSTTRIRYRRASSAGHGVCRAAPQQEGDCLAGLTLVTSSLGGHGAPSQPTKRREGMAVDGGRRRGGISVGGILVIIGIVVALVWSTVLGI